MDPASVTALYVTILFCANGGGVKDGMCRDGSPQEHSMRIISRPANGPEILFEYDENGTPKFTLYPDGSITHAAKFQVDDAALAFWRAVANTYKESCPSLSSVLDPLTKGEIK